MSKANENSAFGTMLKLLYQPIPYLPEMSFLEKGRSAQRRKQALAKIKEKAPQERKIRGTLELIGKGKCRICGHEVEISESTWVFGDIREGAVAEMTIIENKFGYNAKRIVII